MEKGSGEGLRPFGGSMRVSLRCKFFPLPGQACPEFIGGKGARGMVGRVFQHAAKKEVGVWVRVLLCPEWGGPVCPRAPN